MPGAIVFDLLNGGDKDWAQNPYPALGRAALAGAGHKVARFDGLTSDPRADQIEAAADRARTFGADGVVGLGGGSALDVAKMTAAVTPVDINLVPPRASTSGCEPADFAGFIRSRSGFLPAD